MGFIQRILLKAQHHIFFERSEIKDRHLVVKRYFYIVHYLSVICTYLISLFVDSLQIQPLLDSGCFADRVKACSFRESIDFLLVGIPLVSTFFEVCFKDGFSRT